MMKHYFKYWQFWLRICFVPISSALQIISWLGEQMVEVSYHLYNFLDDTLPDIPEDKTELKKRFDKQSKKVDDLHK